MSVESWAALLTALGIGTLLSEVVRAIIKGVSGKVGRERSAIEYERSRSLKIQQDADARIRAMQEDVDRMDERVDEEITKRRMADSRAARYERLLILNGIIPNRDLWTNETTVEMRKEEKE